ncbi:MAG: sigma-70 family RNA polymerase sigma factor [Anaerolineales bacterium]|nr:sigma-70 family RNA polymerase sigma factor [Anaerolineales bacterium]
MTRAGSFPTLLTVPSPDAQADARAPETLFERLYAEYERPILNYLYRLVGEPALAEDLTQEAFTRAWNARRDLPRLDNPRAWLYRIATNLARDHFRRARLLSWLPLLGNEPALTEAAPDGDPLEAERLRRALLELAPDYRVPLVLYTCQELSVAEVAAALGLSPEAVKQRLVRARRQLRDAYGPPG